MAAHNSTRVRTTGLLNSGFQDQPSLFPSPSKRKKVSANASIFDGADYQPLRDNPRLSSQLERIFNLMKDGEWRSLGRISVLTGDPEPSISSQLRHLRKERFGKHTVNRRYMGDGLYEYSLVINREVQQ